MDVGYGIAEVSRTRSTPLSTTAYAYVIAPRRSDDCIKVLASALDGENIDLIVANAGVFRMDGPGIDGIDKHFPEMVEQFNVNTLGPIRTVCGLDKCLKEGSKVAIIGSLFGSIAENADGGMFGYRMSKVTAGVTCARKQCFSIPLRARRSRLTSAER